MTIVLAGPGSGKTRVLTHRIAWLVQQKRVKPWEILAVTFTNKAAGEVKDRLARLLSPARAEKVTARTFHSFGARLLRYEMAYLAPLLPDNMFTAIDYEQHGARVTPRLAANFSIYDADDQKGLLKAIVVETMGYDAKRIPEARRYISRAKNRGWLPNHPTLQQQVQAEELDFHHEVYARYQAQLLTLNALDFDDLCLLPMLHFRWNTGRLQVYQDRFPHVLIDEYQDTNDTQFTLSCLLASHSRRNLFVVGDEDQSIYGFRFADYRHVKGLQRAFPDHDLVFLEQNYRSKSGIVSAGQKLIEHNRDRAKKKLWTDNPGPSVVDTMLCYDQIEEAKTVADLIEAQIENGTPANEIAVLYRTHALSRAIETVLVRRKIPYQLARGVAFYERMEVRDVLAWLWVLFNGDTQKFARIANRPKMGIGPKTVDRIVNAASDLMEWLQAYHAAGQALDARSALPKEWKSHALEHGLKVGGGMAEKIWRLSQVAAHLKQVVEGGSVPEVVDGVIQVLRPYWETFENTDERLENAMELFTVAQTIRATGEEGLRQFLDQVSLVTQGDDMDGEAELVTLATIHAVKGLEYDVVVVVGVEEGLIPHERSSSEAELAEERRLLYVAVTRARRAVYLSHTIARTLFGATRCNPPSLFLEEMGLHLSI